MKIQNQKKKSSTSIIVVICLILLFIAYFSLAYITKSMWPFRDSTSTNDTVTLPKVKSTDNSTKKNSSQEDSSNNTSIPTKTEDKTPTQYEGEQSSDTPEYNNEQFRIPEDQ